ncbi:hypothetical protein H4O14_15275 [Bacillus sp. PAMC26568]|nr:hypothetical protein H4O14_15275 [Bacillus sp. PAMC26568]
MNSLLQVIAHVLTAIAAVLWIRHKEFKQDRLLYIALMIGGFVWSQLQTEYLILRIKKNTEKTLKKG